VIDHYIYRNLPWVENANGIQSGRVLVSLDSRGESRLDLYNYEGSNLPAYLLYIVLKIALGEDWAEKLEKMHQNRKNRWKVEVQTSPCGEKTYEIYTAKQSEIVTQSELVSSSCITISKGKINTFSIFSEDAAPLLKKLLRIIRRLSAAL
jgi:hypothetical protein